MGNQSPMQGTPYQQGGQQQQYQQPQQQSKQPLDRGMVQVPVGVYASKKNFNPDGSPKQETDFLPIGKWAEWEKHITVDIFVNGEKLSMMLFKTPPQNNNQNNNQQY